MQELICDSCGKEAKFKVHRSSGTDRLEEWNLCPKCAGELERILSEKVGKPLPDALKSLSIEPCQADEVSERISVCPNCGNRAEEVSEAGIVGCPTCYTVFDEEVKMMIRKLHGI